MKGKKDKLFSKKVLTFSVNGCIIVLKKEINNQPKGEIDYEKTETVQNMGRSKSTG
jgi:hypothetical protein